MRLFPTISDRTTRWILLASGAVLIVHLIIAVQVGFLSDDFNYLKSVRLLQSAGDYLDFIAKPLGTAFEWRPASGIWWIVEHALFGMTSWLYHLTRIVLIGLTMAIMFRLVTRLFNPRAGAVAVLLFLLMPFHSEAMYWLADVTDLLGLAGSFGSVWFGLKYLDHGRAGHLVASIVLFIIGVTGKEFAAATPFVIGLFDLAINGIRQPGLQRRRIMLYGLTVGTMLASLVLRAAILGSLAGDTRGRSVIGAILSVEPYQAMVSRMIILFNLESLRDLAPSAVSFWVNLRKVLAVVGALTMAVIAWQFRHDKKWLAAGAVGMAIVLVYAAPQAFVLPYVSLMNLQHARFLYAPSAGVAIVLAVLLVAKKTPHPRWLTGLQLTVMFGMIALFSIATAVNARPWLAASRARETVLNDLARRHPDIIMASAPTTLYVDAIPEQIDGAFVFRDKQSFGEAVWRRFENQNLTVVLLKNNPDGQTACTQVWQPNRVCVRWDGTGFWRDPATGGLPGPYR